MDFFLLLQERNLLLDELLKNRNQESRDLEDLEGERVQLSLLEEKIKEVLHMLRSLNSMVNYLVLKCGRVTHLSDCKIFCCRIFRQRL